MSMLDPWSTCFYTLFSLILKFQLMGILWEIVFQLALYVSLLLLINNLLFLNSFLISVFGILAWWIIWKKSFCIYLLLKSCYENILVLLHLAKPHSSLTPISCISLPNFHFCFVFHSCFLFCVFGFCFWVGGVLCHCCK